MGILALTGWIAVFAFAGMLATCVCFYGCQRRLAGKTKTKTDDYFVSIMHKAHKWFVLFTVIATNRACFAGSVLIAGEKFQKRSL